MPRAHLSLCAIAQLGVLGLAGCSLVLPRLSAAPCDIDVDCADLASRFPTRETSCLRFQCDQALHRCFLGPLDRDRDGHTPVLECGGDDCDDDDLRAFGGRPETCDGVDNDCNELIDDGTSIAWGTGTARAGAGPVAGAAWATESAGALGLSIMDGALSAGVSLDRVNAALLGTTRAVRLEGLAMPDNASVVSLAAGCPSGLMGAPTQPCTPAQVAVASGAPVGWAAFVHRNGCDDGMLRVGLLDTGAGTIELVGPDSRSNTWRGVDLGGGTCTRTAGGAGATAPAVVTATNGASETAVLGWLRDRASRSCGSPTEVAAVGLWRAVGTAGGMTGFDWIVATNGGVAQVLGNTAGIAPPALVATGTGEVIAAFGEATGGVRLLVIEALSAVPAGPTATPPIVLGESLVFGEGIADGVALTFTALGDGTARLGVAWTAGCGGGVPHFASVLWRRSERTFSPSAVVALGTGTAREPTLAYVGHGFIRPTATRGGGNVGETDGGWLAVWRDESASPPALVSQRVLAVDGALVDEGPLPLLFEETANPRWPFVYPGGDGASLNLAVFSADTGALVGTRILSCR